MNQSEIDRRHRVMKYLREKQGYSYARIAAHLECSEGTVAHWLQKGPPVGQGYRRPKVTPAGIEQATSMFKAGYAWPEIGKALGVCPETARDWWRKGIGFSERPEIRKLPPVPKDTRSITGRLCGDPLPGRSALDRRAGA